MEKVNVTCRLNADDVAFLDTLGEQVDRDRSYLIKQAVARFIAHQRWQVEEVQRAIAEADEGNVLTDKEFAADMKKWRK
jgi:RHH-type rel operon transcriptional repressor/antitoxin RelB